MRQVAGQQLRAVDYANHLRPVIKATWICGGLDGWKGLPESVPGETGTGRGGEK